MINLYFIVCVRIINRWECERLIIGNISGANQSLCANRANFNMGHWINIQGTAHGEWEEGFAKVWLEAGD